MGCNESTAASGSYDRSSSGFQSPLNIHGEESIFSRRMTGLDDDILNKIDNPNRDIDIQLADSSAFNNSFVQQRQKAIMNQQYEAVVKTWNPSSIKQLADTFSSFSRGKSILDQHWIIYMWIGTNISYDTTAYFSGKYGDQSAETVFRTRKGVCAGYANLYKYLCDVIKLPCEIVGGYSKGYGFEDRVDAPSRTDHAWNAVEIDRHWYLIESTWGSGHLNEARHFVQAFEPYYFLPRPDEMIYHHLPEIEKWQLLKRPIHMNQFMTIANLRPISFSYQIDLVQPRHQTHLLLLPGKSYALAILRVPDDVHLLSDLTYQNHKIEGSSFMFYDRRKQVHRCYFAAVGSGRHKISIYAKRGGSDTGSYTGALDFILDVPQMPANRVSFPRVWENFFSLGMEVISPTNTNVISMVDGSSKAEVVLRAAEDTDVVARLKTTDGHTINGADLVFYDRRNRFWRCFFAPNHDGLFEALILAKRISDSGQYTSAISFKIDAKRIPSPPCSFPEIWPLFHDLGLHIEVPRDRANAVWPDDGVYTEVLIRSPPNVQLTAHIAHDDVDVEDGTLAQYDNEKRLWRLLFAPQRTGNHELIVFGKDMHDDKSPSHSVAKFGLHVPKLKRTIKFPKIYTQFQSKKCQIISPIEGHLKRGALVSLNFIIPGASEVIIYIDSNPIPTTGYTDSVLKQDVRVGSKSVGIYAKFGRSGNYDGLALYQVH